MLDKAAGDIKKVTGPQIFLPDPRNETIVRRALDDRTVVLWYPGNIEALTFNQNLRNLAEDSASYLADSVVVAASADISRSINRGTAGNKALGSLGESMSRGTKFTPPPQITLNTKYDGVPSINVWTGWAVQVVDKAGHRRVEVGPTTILLEYDESLEILELSTGKPKTTDNLMKDVYLRVDNNLVSDIINVETKDLVNIGLKVSYRVNFLREHKEKWFNVQNYVKYLCDHMRSLLKASMKKQGVKDVMENSAAMIRDVVLGEKVEGKKRNRQFPENGMEVYDVEVLGVQIVDEKIANLLKTAQQRAVESAITLSADEQNLVNIRRKTEIEKETKELETSVTLRKEKLTQEAIKASSVTAMTKLKAEIDEAVFEANAEVEAQKQKDAVATAEANRRKMVDDQDLALEGTRAELFAKRMEAITPDLIAAMNTLGQTEFATKLAIAVAPLALNEQTGLGTTLERVFKGTALETVLTNLQTKAAVVKK